MNKYKTTLLMLIASSSCYSTEYVGKLGSIDITASFTSNEYFATYMYNKFKTPIELIKSNDSSDTQLVYIEKNGNIESALFSLNKVNNDLVGYWLNKKTGKKLPVILHSYDDARGELQSQSFKKSYFRLSCDDQGKFVTIIDKNTDKDITRIALDGMCRHNELETGDYNFDGFEDFSVFESYYSGPNTTSLYYLYNPHNKKFDYSAELSLTSLVFDPIKKTVTSTNQCCAGASISIDTFQWQGSKLKLINGKCIKRNDEGAKIIKPRKACD